MPTARIIILADTADATAKLDGLAARDQPGTDGRIADLECRLAALEAASLDVLSGLL